MKRIVEGLFVLATVAVFSVPAQDSQPKQQPKNDSGIERSSPVHNPVVPANAFGTTAPNGLEGSVIHDFFFNGGTVRELVAVLREAGRKAGLPPLNVIVTDETQEQTVPQLELHNVRYADILRALNQLNKNGTNGEWQLSTTGES